MNWINIARNRIPREAVVHAVMKPKFLWQAEEFLTFWATVRAADIACPTD